MIHIKIDGETLTVIFGIIGVISMVLSIFFYIKNMKKSEKLIDKMNISTKKIGKTTKQVEAISKHLSFGSIKPFPLGLEDVIELLKGYVKTAKDENREFCLDIYTDVPGYAAFSHNKLWNDFYDCLKDICSKREAGFPIYWYFYSERHLENQIKEQFSSWRSYDLTQLKKEIYLRSSFDIEKNGYKTNEKRLNFQHGSAENCKYSKSGTCRSEKDEECKKIIELKIEFDKLKNNNEVSQFVDEKVINTMKYLHNNAVERIKQLSSSGTVKYKRLNENLPFFAWIILEKTEVNKKQYKLTPIEGIVSYNYYDEKKEAIEKGFRTSDSMLIRSLYDIVHSSSKQQLERQLLEIPNQLIIN